MNKYFKTATDEPNGYKKSYEKLLELIVQEANKFIDSKKLKLKKFKTTKQWSNFRDNMYQKFNHTGGDEIEPIPFDSL